MAPSSIGRAVLSHAVRTSDDGCVHMIIVLPDPTNHYVPVENSNQRWILDDSMSTITAVLHCRCGCTIREP